MFICQINKVVYILNVSLDILVRYLPHSTWTYRQECNKVKAQWIMAMHLLIWSSKFYKIHVYECECTSMLYTQKTI